MRLTRVHPASFGAIHQVEASWGVDAGRGLLRAEFRVEGPRPRVNPALPVGVSQWGLWDWDVVEVFVSAGQANTPYLELQLSPLGQHVELLIHEPRRRWDAEFRSGFRGETRPWDGRAWTARFEVPLTPLGWNGDPVRVRGNFFAILGEPERREYFSAFLPPQAQPDFHLPDRFRPLA
jgi:hypothetical protein